MTQLVGRMPDLQERPPGHDILQEHLDEGHCELFESVEAASRRTKTSSAQSTCDTTLIALIMPPNSAVALEILRCVASALMESRSLAPYLCPTTVGFLNVFA